MSSSSEKKIWVLYASQTGNSEQAARQIVDLLPSKLSSGNVKGQAMQLDDFLELEYAPWTGIVIICMSSYGAGQAPLGGYRFRELCDYVIENNKTSLLQGLQFALLGLGDSKYTTYFQNPTQTNEALEMAGATRIGPIGKADNSNQQPETIEAWIAGLWKPLQAALDDTTTLISEERLNEMQNDTCAISAKINPDFKAITNEKSMVEKVVPFILAITAIILGVIIQQILQN